VHFADEMMKQMQLLSVDNAADFYRLLHAMLLLVQRKRQEI